MKRTRTNNNQQMSSKGHKIKRVRSIPTTYILPRNTKLYQSVSSRIQLNETYPSFFATTPHIANLYLLLKSGNICKTFQTTSGQRLIILGEPSTEVERMIEFLESHIPRVPRDYCTVFKSLSQIFFGNTDNINDVIIAINFLKDNKKLIKAMINGFNTDKTNYILFMNPNDGRLMREMYAKLDSYLKKISDFRTDPLTATMRIMPSRITERNWDSLFCNLLKQYFGKLGIKGFIVNEYTSAQFVNFKSKHIITLNELIHGIGVQTPPEICLLKGYENLVDRGVDCKQIPQMGGTKNMSALKIKIKKLKSERTKLKKKIKAAKKKIIVAKNKIKVAKNKIKVAEKKKKAATKKRKSVAKK